MARRDPQATRSRILQAAAQHFAEHGLRGSRVDAIAGAFRVAPGVGLPHLLLSNLEVSQGDDTLYGQGSVQYDGHIVLDLASGRKQVRLTGSLLPIRPEAVPGR